MISNDIQSNHSCCFYRHYRFDRECHGGRGWRRPDEAHRGQQARLKPLETPISRDITSKCLTRTASEVPSESEAVILAAREHGECVKQEITVAVVSAALPDEPYRALCFTRESSSGWYPAAVQPEHLQSEGREQQQWAVFREHTQTATTVVATTKAHSE